MLTRGTLEDMERRISDAGVSHETFFQEAGISASTWWRWREGKFMPQMRKWAEVQSAFEKLVPTQ